MAKREPTAGDFSAALLQQGSPFISPAPGELIEFTGRCYNAHAPHTKQGILRFITATGGDRYATARMVDDVYETICISQTVPGSWRPFLLSAPQIEPVSVLTLSDSNLWIKKDGSHEFKPHDPDVVTTAHTDYNADTNGKTCPEFEAFLDWFVLGRASLKQYVVQVMALLLCRFLDPQIIPIFIGSGANGKGVLFNTIRRMVGEGNCCSVPMDRLGERFSLNQLKHKFVNIDADLCETSKAREATLKKLCDRSLSEFERKYRDAESMACYATFLFGSNSYIPFRDRTNGLGRRIRYLPCDNTVTAADKVEKFENLFWMPGVLNRVLAEVPNLVKFGLVDCPFVQAATVAGRLDGNPAHQFLAQHVAVRPGQQLIKSFLFGLYKNWCDENGYKNLAAGNFGKEVASFFSDEVRQGDVVLDAKTKTIKRVRPIALTAEQWAKQIAKSDPIPRRNCYIGLTYCATGVENLDPPSEPVTSTQQETIPF